MRYKRLQHLLQKSNIYSKFLLTKMEQQQNEVRRVCRIRAAAAPLDRSKCFVLLRSGKAEEGENRQEGQEGEARFREKDSHLLK